MTDFRSLAAKVGQPPSHSKATFSGLQWNTPENQGCGFLEQALSGVMMVLGIGVLRAVCDASACILCECARVNIAEDLERHPWQSTSTVVPANRHTGFSSLAGPGS